jgi:hypothetical protein
MVYDVGATPVTAEAYGLPWTQIIVPEPTSAVALMAGAGTAVVVLRRRRRSDM